MIISFKRNINRTSYIALVTFSAFTLTPKVCFANSDVGTSKIAVINGINETLNSEQMKELLATMGESPESLAVLSRMLNKQDLNRLRSALHAASPRNSLEEMLVEEGYEKDEAARLVLNLEDEEIANILEYDVHSGGYVYVAPAFVAACCVGGVLILFIIGLIIHDQSSKKRAAQLQNQMLRDDLREERSTREVLLLREEIKRLRDIRPYKSEEKVTPSF